MKIYIVLLVLCCIIAQIDGTRKRYFRKKILRRKLPLCTRKAIQANETDFVVCASDGNTFTNRSELCENLRANRSLSVVHPGECGNCTTENVCLSGLLPKRYVRPRKAFRLLRKFLGKKLNISGGNKTNETNAFNIRFNNSTCQKLIAKCEAFRDNSTIITAPKRIVLKIIKKPIRKVIKVIARKGKKGRKCRGRVCLIKKVVIGKRRKSRRKSRML